VPRRRRRIGADGERSSGICKLHLERAERGVGITVRTLRAIAQALEDGGIEFLQN
jgi:hypothetical protein